MCKKLEGKYKLRSGLHSASARKVQSNLASLSETGGKNSSFISVTCLIKVCSWYCTSFLALLYLVG